jgi:hypothetical protein
MARSKIEPCKNRDAKIENLKRASGKKIAAKTGSYSSKKIEAKIGRGLNNGRDGRGQNAIVSQRGLTIVAPERAKLV